jgi:glycosyltransferase involved in cell wall biosynthesis
MRKKRILLCGEYSGLNSGYANWSRNLLEGLYESGKYEVAELACFCTTNDLKSNKSKWKIYPNAVLFSDERYKTYKSSTNNTYGQWRFDAVCLDFRPDIVIDFRDPWMFEYQSFSALRRYFKWIIMPPIDSIPQKNEWITIFSNADLVIPYTNWAKDCLSSFNNLKTFDKITPAGVDSQIFKPKKISKENFGLPKDTFVIGSVMRNQKRKLIPALFEMISKMENSILYLHTTYPELSGWNIPSLLLEFNVMNKVYFTYKCKLCKKHYCSNYSGINTVCKHCSNTGAVFATTSSGITDEQLSEIYNLFDIYIQYAVCEGFGMPQIEASSCGIPVFSVDYSAMSEVVRNIDGFPIPLSNLQYEMESNAKRSYPNIDETINLINKYRNLNQEEKDAIKNNTRINTIKYYSWDDIIEVWQEAIDSMDISTSKDWNDSNKYQIPENVNLDYSLSNFDFINHICCNIIQEPGLMKTQMIQHTLYSLDHGVSRDGPSIQKYSKKTAAENLERFARQKEMLEHIRVTPGKINEDYINYEK